MNISPELHDVFTYFVITDFTAFFPHFAVTPVKVNKRFFFATRILS